MWGLFGLFLVPVLVCLCFFGLSQWVGARELASNASYRSRSGYYFGRSLPRTYTINAGELALMLGVSIVFVFVSYNLFRDSLKSDLEFLNGHIASVQSRHVSCDQCHGECAARDDDGNCTSWREWCDPSYDIEYYATTDFYLKSDGSVLFNEGFLSYGS